MRLLGLFISYHSPSVIVNFFYGVDNDALWGVLNMSYLRGVSKLLVLIKWAISGPQDVERVASTDPTFFCVGIWNKFLEY